MKGSYIQSTEYYEILAFVMPGTNIKMPIPKNNENKKIYKLGDGCIE